MATVKGTEPISVRYTRDATDRIVERNVIGLPLQRYGFSGDGDSPDFTMNLAGLVTERMVSLPGGAFITKRSLGDVWSYPNIHSDVMATADGSGAKQGSTRTYDPYGEALGELPDNSDGNLDYGWLGKHMRATEHEGLPGVGNIATIEMGARAYVPGLARFLEVDPVAGGSENDYDYSGADPINSFDLDGRLCFIKCGWKRLFSGLDYNLSGCLVLCVQVGWHRGLYVGFGGVGYGVGVGAGPGHPVTRRRWSGSEVACVGYYVGACGSFSPSKKRGYNGWQRGRWQWNVTFGPRVGVQYGPMWSYHF